MARTTVLHALRSSATITTDCQVVLDKPPTAAASQYHTALKRDKRNVWILTLHPNDPFTYIYIYRATLKRNIEKVCALTLLVLRCT